MALGDKGKKLAQNSMSNLFAKTEKTGQAEVGEQTTGAEQPSVRKQFLFPHDLNEQLRLYAYTQRCKEVDVVRDALEQYLAAHNDKTV